MKLEINKTYEIGDKKFRLNEDLELVEIERSIHALKEGDKYYLIDECGNIQCTSYQNEGYDDDLLEIGNAFLTEEEARFELERRKIIAKIKKWKYENDDDYKFVYRNHNYLIEYEFDNKNFYVYWQRGFGCGPDFQYFSSEEKARECLEFIGEENWKKYVLEIK